MGDAGWTLFGLFLGGVLLLATIGGIGLMAMKLLEDSEGDDD